jgi:hypothetical protein
MAGARHGNGELTLTVPCETVGLRGKNWLVSTGLTKAMFRQLVLLPSSGKRTSMSQLHNTGAVSISLIKTRQLKCLIFSVNKLNCNTVL